jgi:hypothetical protein
VRFKLMCLAALSVGCLYGAGIGQLQPKIQLADGAIAHSWDIAQNSGQAVVSVSPSSGWLKLILGLMSAGGFAMLTKVSEGVEDEEDMVMAQQQQTLLLAGESAELDKNFNLQRQAIEYQAQLEVHKSVAQAEAELRAEQGFAPLPAIPQQQAQNQQMPMSNGAIAQTMPIMPKTEFVTASTGSDRNIPEEFARNPKTALIIGVPGAGKGMFVANTIRLLREKSPELKVFGIDPKNDPKETGYWAEGYDKVWRTDNESMTDEAFIAWLDKCIAMFKAELGEKLLVFDEITLSFRRWGAADKKSFDAYTNYKISVASSGDSRGIYIWEVGQVAHASDLNVSGGLRGISKPFAIASNQDRRATDILLSTKFVPLPPNGKTDVFAMCDKSPVGRAIYDYMSDSWQPMPALKNYSGFNRDTREFIGEQPASEPDTQKHPESLADTVPAVTVKPTKEVVLSMVRSGYGIDRVVCMLWNTHPESPEWKRCTSECKALLDG